MPNIKKEIESLKAKIARLEIEQQKAEEEAQAINTANEQIDKILSETGVSLEAYIGFNLKKFSRIVHKIEGQQPDALKVSTQKTTKKRGSRKGRRASKPTLTVKIPAGKYGNLPNQPDQIFEVKEKGPRPKLLKAYAEEVGLEIFLNQCRL
ncbi:MAG: hypothetical protein P8179_07990 [Candidatus Thiodiazotropha sp.]|jgi:hypothetical protein